MKADPLTRAEREGLAASYVYLSPAVRERYDATVDEILARVDNAIAMLDGHTCHEGHTDADHLRLYRDVVREIREVVAEAGPSG